MIKVTHGVVVQEELLNILGSDNKMFLHVVDHVVVVVIIIIIFILMIQSWDPSLTSAGQGCFRGPIQNM